MISWKTFFSVIILLVVALIWWLFLVLLYSEDNQFLRVINTNILLGPIVACSAPLGILVLLARDRLSVTITIFIMPIFWAIIISPGADPKLDAGITSWSMIILLPLILLSVAPAKAVSRRLIWLALGLLLLIALNELSKLGLDLAAPQG